MHFQKAICHTYLFGNQKIIKMNDTMIDVFYTMYSNLYHFTHFRMVLKLIFDMLALFCRIKAAKDNKSNSLKADFFAFRLLLSAGILMNSYFLKNTERLKPRLGLNYLARIIVAQRKNRAYLLLQFLYSDQVDCSFQH